MRNLLLTGLVMLAAACPPPGDDDDVPTSYDGVWSANWSFQVDLINTGTIFAHDCAFHGGTTFTIWGENNFGPVRGTESMVCANANNPSAQYEWGGHIDGGSSVISGSFTYWGADRLTFAGSCSSPSSCQATGSNAFVLTLARQP